MTGMAQITAMARVQSLAWELLHAMGAAKKKKKGSQPGRCYGTSSAPGLLQARGEAKKKKKKEVNQDEVL